MALVVVAVCAGVKFGLDVYTHHGESIAIPDVRRKSFADADYLLREAGMTVVVSDTGYVRGLRPTVFWSSRLHRANASSRDT